MGVPTSPASRATPAPKPLILETHDGAPPSQAKATKFCMLVCPNEGLCADLAGALLRGGNELRASRSLSPDHAAFVLRNRAIILLVQSDDAFGELGRVRALGIDAPVLVLEQGLDRKRRSDLLQHGASECLSLPLSRPALDKALVLLSNQNTRSSSCSLWFDASTHQVGLGDSAANLSSHEFALLRCLVDSEGAPVPTDRLRFYAWGASGSYKSEQQLVTVLICRLRKKLALIGLSNSIRVVRRIGYAFDSPAVREIQGRAPTQGPGEP